MKYQFTEPFHSQLVNNLRGLRADGKPYSQHRHARAIPKPTQKQLDFLRKLGFEGDAPVSMREASMLIDERMKMK